MQLIRHACGAALVLATAFGAAWPGAAQTTGMPSAGKAGIPEEPPVVIPAPAATEVAAGRHRRVARQAH